MAIWNGVRGISKTPATSGTKARAGPKKRPRKIAQTPYFLVNVSPLAIRLWWFRSGQTWCALSSR